jgi:hypothetical protein
MSLTSSPFFCAQKVKAVTLSGEVLNTANCVLLYTNEYVNVFPHKYEHTHVARAGYL